MSFPAEYELQVSSPGLDRKFYKLSDYQKFLGRLVRVRTSKAIRGLHVIVGRFERIQRRNDRRHGSGDEKGSRLRRSAGGHQRNAVGSGDLSARGCAVTGSATEPSNQQPGAECSTRISVKTSRRWRTRSRSTSSACSRRSRMPSPPPRASTTRPASRWRPSSTASAAR